MGAILSNREYYNFLNKLVECYPHYFNKISYIKNYEANIPNNKVFDPFRKKLFKKETFSTYETVFILRRNPLNDEPVAFFNDLGVKNSGEAFFNVDSTFKKFFNRTVQSEYGENSGGTFLWLYFWAKLLNIEVNFDSKIEGIKNIISRKEDDATKIEMLTRHIFTSDQYKKFNRLEANKWDTVFVKKTYNENFWNPALFLNETRNSESNHEKYADTLNTLQSVAPHSNSCHECFSESENLKLLPSLNNQYYYYLCEECYMIKKEQYCKTVNYYIEQNDVKTLTELASSPHLTVEQLELLSFNDDKNLRDNILTNPNITDSVKTVLHLQK